MPIRQINFSDQHKNKEELIFGFDTHMALEENNKLKNLLQIPFQKSRSAKNS